MVTFYQVTFFHYRFRVYFSAQFSQLIVVVRWKVIGVVPHTTLQTFVCLPSLFPALLSSTNSAPLVGTLMYARDSIFIESSNGSEICWKTLKVNFLSIAKLLAPTQAHAEFRVLFVGSVGRKLFACGRGFSHPSPNPNPLSINLVHMFGLPENCLTLWTGNGYLALGQAFTVCLRLRCGSFLFALTCGPSWGRGTCTRGNALKEFQSALTTFLLLTHTAQLWVETGDWRRLLTRWLVPSTLVAMLETSIWQGLSTKCVCVRVCACMCVYVHARAWAYITVVYAFGVVINKRETTAKMKHPGQA